MKQLPTYQSFVFGKEDGDTGVNLAHGQRHQHLGGYCWNCYGGAHLKGGRLGVVVNRERISTADRKHEVEACLSLSGEYPCLIGTWHVRAWSRVRHRYVVHFWDILSLFLHGHGRSVIKSKSLYTKI